MTNKDWLFIDAEHEVYNQIAEGTYIVKMFNLDAGEASQAEYDREAEIDALNETLDQQSIVMDVTGSLLDNGSF